MHKVIKAALFLLFISSACKGEHYIETTASHKDGSQHYIILADNGYIIGSATDPEFTEDGSLIYKDPTNNGESRLIKPLSDSKAQKMTSHSYELN